MPSGGRCSSHLNAALHAEYMCIRDVFQKNCSTGQLAGSWWQLMIGPMTADSVSDAD